MLDLIVTTEARPPRQIDDTIPKELERICLRRCRSERPIVTEPPRTWRKTFGCSFKPQAARSRLSPLRLP